jgi:hypothetical protein
MGKLQYPFLSFKIGCVCVCVAEYDYRYSGLGGTVLLYLTRVHVPGTLYEVQVPALQDVCTSQLIGSCAYGVLLNYFARALLVRRLTGNCKPCSSVLFYIIVVEL